jgi:hypothetical protein
MPLYGLMMLYFSTGAYLAYHPRLVSITLKASSNTSCSKKFPELNLKNVSRT